MKLMIRKLFYYLFVSGYEHPNVGEILYSPFYDDFIVVTYYKRDNEWRFRFIDQVSDFEHNAETTFSYFIENGYDYRSMKSGLTQKGRCR